MRQENGSFPSQIGINLREKVSLEAAYTEANQFPGRHPNENYFKIKIKCITKKTYTEALFLAFKDYN